MPAPSSAQNAVRQSLTPISSSNQTPPPLRVVGIDLAWGRVKTTAAVVMERETSGVFTVAASNDHLTDDQSLLDFVRDHDCGGSLLIAIDAPTLVPNESGRRPCEAECQRLFARYSAGPHPSNRQLYRGDIRGEFLVQRLASMGIEHNPYLAAPIMPGHCVRQSFEVFPHPAHVVLFGLATTLKYKAKPGRSREFRNQEMNRYIDYLRSLSQGEPSLNITSVDFTIPPRAGAALKRLEDLLDAITCAYVGSFYAHWGLARMTVLGDLSSGAIVVPNAISGV